MNHQRARQLTDRYFAGETSLAEESDLRGYFATGDVCPELADYAPIFGYFSQRTPVRRRKPRSLRYWTAAAASLLLLLAVNFWGKRQPALNQFPVAEKRAVDWSKYEVTDEKEAIRLLHGALSPAGKDIPFSVE